MNNKEKYSCAENMLNSCRLSEDSLSEISGGTDGASEDKKKSVFCGYCYEIYRASGTVPPCSTCEMHCYA